MKRDRRILIWLQLLAILLIVVPASAAHYPMRVKDSRGKIVVIRAVPKRIVSLAPSNTEILFALGLGSRVVADTTFCDYPAEAKKKPHIGAQVTSVEKVIAMRPDLVVAHGNVNDDAIRAIERYGVTVFAINPTSLSQLTKDIKTLGNITGTSKAAAKVVGRIESTKAMVSRKLAGVKTRPTVLVAIQADPLWAAGRNTFVDEMLRIAHATNLAADGRPGFNQYSTEKAVVKNPDVIIGTYKDDRRVFTSGQWKSTKAARSGRVYELRPDLIVRDGPRLADGLLAIAKAVHPDAFRKR